MSDRTPIEQELADKENALNISRAEVDRLKGLIELNEAELFNTLRAEYDILGKDNSGARVSDTRIRAEITRKRYAEPGTLRDLWIALAGEKAKKDRLRAECRQLERTYWRKYREQSL